jgi:uncharacterized protein YdcH (DUF465 family)
MSDFKSVLISLSGAISLFVAGPRSEALAASVFGDPTELTLLDGFGGFHNLDGSGDSHNGGVARTQAQFDQENAVIQAHEAEVETLKQRMQALSDQISNILSGSGAVDTSVLSSLEQQRSDLQAQRDATNLDMLMQIRALLTPAQLADVAQRHAQLSALHQQELALKAEPQFAKAELHFDDLYGDDLGYERGLSLPDEEVSQIHIAIGHHIAPINSLVRQQQAVRQQLSDALNSPGPLATAQISSLQQQESALKQQLSMVRLDMVVAARAPLTPDQLAKAAALHQQILALQAAKAEAIQSAKSGN